MKNLTLCVTNDCNLACPYCYEKDKDAKNMSPTFAAGIVEEEKPDSLAIFGGEPLLNWPATRAAILAYGKGAGITTNLTLLTDEMIYLFKEMNVQILVSIDGTKEVHDKNRCGSYDTVAANVKKLVAAGCGRQITARMTILPEDAPYVVEGIRDIMALGIQNIAPVIVTDVPWSEDQITDMYLMVDMVFSYVLAHYNSDEKRNLSVKMVDDFIEANLSAVISHRVPCGIGRRDVFSIGPEGERMPCHQRHTIANRREELIIVDGKQTITPIKPFEWKPETGDCSECRAAPICSGWCPSESIDRFGDTLTVPRIACEFYRACFDATEKYQYQIVEAPALRNRRLNMLRFNLRLLHNLTDLMQMSPADERFPYLLMEFYSNLTGNKDAILPQFAEYFSQVFNSVEVVVSEPTNDDQGERSGHAG